MKVIDVVSAVDRFAPFSTQMDFDNSGLLIGDENSKVSNILVCLDVTKDVIKLAVSLSCELIISHHPVIFSPLLKIQSNSIPYMLIKAGISVVCAHTNLDIAFGGVSDVLASKLELQNVESFGLSNDLDSPLLGRIGQLKLSMTEDEFVKFVLGKFDAFRYTQGKEIKTVAVCGGSGGECIYRAASLGADAFLTGEIKHHQLLDAAKMGLMIIDAGHFATEEIIREPLAKYLRSQLDGVNIHASREMDICKTVVSQK